MSANDSSTSRSTWRPCQRTARCVAVLALQAARRISLTRLLRTRRSLASLWLPTCSGARWTDANTSSIHCSTKSCVRQRIERSGVSSFGAKAVAVSSVSLPETLTCLKLSASGVKSTVQHRSIHVHGRAGAVSLSHERTSVRTPLRVGCRSSCCSRLARSDGPPYRASHCEPRCAIWQ